MHRLRGKLTEALGRPDKALDLVDQACAAASFQTFPPRKQSAASIIGREEIARVVVARCGIPVGMLTVD